MLFRIFFFLPVALFVFSVSFGQAVGFGTTTPHPSALVDFTSNNKGVLIPRLTSAERIAIAAPAPGLLVYDLTLQSLMYFHDGWKSTHELQLPFTKTQSASSPLLSLSNTGTGGGISANSFNGAGVSGFSQSGVGLSGTTNTGYGGLFISYSFGVALGVNGKIEVSGSSGKTGSAMVVNSDGNPIWMTASAFSVKDVGSIPQSIANATDVLINFTSEDYDLDADYSTTNKVFTAPTNGIYHFDATILWGAPSTSTGYLAISLFVNSSIHSTVRTPAFSGKEVSNTLSMDVNLTAGQTVRLFAYQTTGATQTLNAATQSCRFTGRLVMKL